MPNTLTAEEFKKRYGSAGQPARLSADEFRSRYGDLGGGGNEPQPTEREKLDIQAQEQYGATFRPDTENPGIFEPLKALGNLPSSIFQFGKAAADWINPISTIKNLASVPGELKALKQEMGGGLQGDVAAKGAFLREMLGHATPESVKAFAGAGKGLVTGDLTGAAEQTERFHRAVTSDPVGQVLPVYGAFRGAVRGTKPGAVLDRAVTDTTRVATAPARAAGRGASATTRYGVGQAIGVQPETVSRVISEPRAFGRGVLRKGAAEEARASLGEQVESGLAARRQRSGINRDTLAEDIQRGVERTRQRVPTVETLGRDLQSAFDTRAKQLTEAGRAYDPIRSSDSYVKVNKGWLENELLNQTGLKLKKGKLSTTADSFIRGSGDVRAFQYLYDLYKPVFNRGRMSTNEFLNFRSDLAGLAKFEKEFAKSQPVESSAKGLRKSFNEKYRSQVGGLEKLDKQYSKQSSEFKELSKGIVDRQGNLTDTGLAKINSAMKDRPNLRAQLDEVVPGIIEKIDQLNRQRIIEKGIIDKSGNITDAGFNKIISKDLSKNPNLAAQLEALSPGIGKKVSVYQEIKALGKGLVDEQGNITDTGTSKIANASGKSKTQLMERLEEIAPGIKKKIEIVKAIEDIESASGIKVGTYTRGGLFFGAATGNIAAIVSLIVSSPAIAVPLLRSYGLLKNSQAVRAVVNGLREVNNSIDSAIIPPNIGAENTGDAVDQPIAETQANTIFSPR